MRNRVTLSILAALVAIPLAATISSASIWGSHKKSSDKTVSLTLAQESKIPNGPILEPGNYRIEVAENQKAPEVTFYRDGKEVAQAKANLVNEAQKNQQTEVFSTTKGNDQVINEIRPAGWNSRLVFSNGSTNSSHAGE